MHARETCSLVPLLDLMWPNAGMSANSGTSTNIDTHLESLLFSAGATCDNKVAPHPTQGGEQFTEGLFGGNERGRMYLEIQVCLTSLHLNMAELWLCHRFTANELLALVAVLRIPAPLSHPTAIRHWPLRLFLSHAPTCTVPRTSGHS